MWQFDTQNLRRYTHVYLQEFTVVVPVKYTNTSSASISLFRLSFFSTSNGISLVIADHACQYLAEAMNYIEKKNVVVCLAKLY